MFNRFMRRLIRKKKVEVIVRSESLTEVLENILERKLNPESALDMGMLDQFEQLNKRLEVQPPTIKEKVRALWFEEIKKIKAESSDQQKEEVCQE